MIERINNEIIIFPEPKVIIYKDDNKVIIDKEYKIVYDCNADPLEVEAAFGIAKRIEELTKLHLQVLDNHKVTKKQKIIFVGTRFKEMLSTNLDTDNPEGYALEIENGRIILSGNTPSGTFYAGETFKQLLKLEGGKLSLPKLIIKDWPDYRYRGLYVESKWGPDLMSLDDWKELIDFMASLKLNFLDIGIYGCWVIQYENQITEFLLLPIKNYPKLKTPKTIMYYSPTKKVWIKLTYLPKMFTDDFFSEVIAYGKKRNVIVRPAFNSLGHNTLIPREYPEISAIDEDGNPTNYGFCLTNPKTLEVMFNIYDEIIDRYLKPHDINFFHIELDEVYAVRGIDPKNPKKVVDPWCKCIECSKKSREELFLDYVMNIIRHLSEKGIEKICIWNDQITRMDLLEKFVVELKKEKLIDKVVIEWWYYGSNEKDLETKRFDFGNFGSEFGLTRWVVPMCGYYFWWMYQSLLQNIYLMLRRGFEKGAEGAIAYCTFDYSFHRNYYCLADFSWNQSKNRDLNQFNVKYAKFVFKDEYTKALKALDALETLSSAETTVNSFLSTLFYYPYSYVHPDKNYPRSYPQEVIERLKTDPEALSKLQKYYEISKNATNTFLSIKKTISPNILDHYIVECLRYQNTIEIFLIILNVLKKYEKFKTLSTQNKNEAINLINEMIDDLDHALELQETLMLNIEKIKSNYLLPQTLRDLSFMLEFLIGLKDELCELKEKYLEGKISQI